LLGGHLATLTLPDVRTLVPWQQILAGALDNNEIVGVAAVVRTYLGREPTRSEITSARRSALRLANAGDAEVVRVPMTGGSPSHDRLLLVWPGTDTTDPIRLREAAADSALPKAVKRSQGANVVVTRSLAKGIADASVSVGEIDIELLTPDDAAVFASQLEDPLRRLQRFRSRLVRRSREG
jgi:hypothetical protein